MTEGMKGDSLQPYPSTGRSHGCFHIFDAISNLRVPGTSEMENTQGVDGQHSERTLARRIKTFLTDGLSGTLHALALCA